MSDAELADELDALLRRAGLTVPPERHAAVLAGYRDLKRMTALLRQPRAAAAELAVIFAPAALTRKA